MSDTDIDHADSGRRPGNNRRRIGLAGASLLLVGVGAAGGAALADHQQDDANQTSSSTTQSRSTKQGSTDTDDHGHGRPGWGGPSTPPRAPDHDSDSAPEATAPESAADATAAQSVGLVEISSTLTNGKGAGTGFILSSAGTVVTNHHVVEGATSLKVTVVSTGKTYTAKYVGGDSTADVAVLKLRNASGLTPVKEASKAAAEGDPVTAVGDAGGDGGALTASTGTVAAIDQHITVRNDDGTTNRLTGLIELNAYVVPGDSGGAVLNAAGSVVGMNVAASTGSRSVTGYAIPVSTVRSVADQILAGKETATIDLGYHGYLGVWLDPSTTAPRVVQVTDGGAAARAGVSVGDTITKLNGRTLTSADQLRNKLAKTAPGERVKVTWKDQSGANRSATVPLGRAPIA